MTGFGSEVVDCSLGPQDLWLRFLAAWLLVSIVVAIVSGNLAAQLEFEARPAKPLGKTFATFITNIYLWVWAVGVVIGINLVSVLIEANPLPEESESLLRASIYMLAVMVLWVFCRICVQGARHWHHRTLVQLRQQAREEDETAALDS
ncbi:MAG: hypothetical protein HXY25_11515 [Alphaproteobacteria bacterium]|nr:hypothetical protein [Alphaproteobacteria bacterium]